METFNCSRRARLFDFMWTTLCFVMWYAQKIEAAIPKLPSKNLENLQNCQAITCHGLVLVFP